MNKRPDITQLKKEAREIRRQILTILSNAGSGHTGGSLSEVEILLSLYRYKLRYNPKDPNWKLRDRFILSKGHGCPALYVVFAHVGYFPKEELMTLRKMGTRLQGHPQFGLPGIETSSGSLGQGLSIANGIALATRLDKLDVRVYCLMGDGETDEGQIWEAALTGSHYKLDNVCGIIDYNKYQIDGRICDIKNLEPFVDKWKAFGWNVIEADGHDFTQLMDVYDQAQAFKGKPSIIIAHTVKGKGVSFIEKDNRWHGTAPNKDELERALKELED